MTDPQELPWLLTALGSGDLYDDRVRPLLLAQAAKRDAREWNREDAEQVVAALLTKLDGPPSAAPAPAQGDEVVQPGDIPVVGTPAYLAARLRGEAFLMEDSASSEAGRGNELQERLRELAPESGIEQVRIERDAAENVSDAVHSALWKADAKIQRLQGLLEGRDRFIVDLGLWSDFVDALAVPALAAGPRDEKLIEHANGWIAEGTTYHDGERHLTGWARVIERLVAILSTQPRVSREEVAWLRGIVRALKIRMATACDWTRAGKDHVKVRTADWHVLMSLWEESRAALGDEK